MDTKATMISILCVLACENRDSSQVSHRVVAFMVKVKLVENKVKRKVGIVMVTNVMSQYRIEGMTLIRASVNLPNVPNQDREA